jgi:hypothetical protein
MQSEYQFNINNTPEMDNIEDTNTDDNTNTNTDTNTDDDININNILIDPNYPDLYKYLKLCAIEQRGIHTLSDIDKNAKNGTIEDINFIRKYIELALETSNIDDNEKKFLTEFDSSVDDNIMVHLTRDCQIFETGSHYVSLNFRTHINNNVNNCANNYINNIKFYMRFKQDVGIIPIDDKKISISHSIDKIINKNNDNYSNHSHIIDINDESYYSRNIINNRYFNINDSIIVGLPSAYMLPANHIIEPKILPDACIIC